MKTFEITYAARSIFKIYIEAHTKDEALQKWKKGEYWADLESECYPEDEPESIEEIT